MEGAVEPADAGVWVVGAPTDDEPEPAAGAEGVDPAEPAGAAPPVDPVPVTPVPVDPVPVDPVPVDPAPVDPVPVDPAPVDPAPVDPAPVDPVVDAGVDDEPVGFPDVQVTELPSAERMHCIGEPELPTAGAGVPAGRGVEIGPGPAVDVTGLGVFAGTVTTRMSVRVVDERVTGLTTVRTDLFDVVTTVRVVVCPVVRAASDCAASAAPDAACRAEATDGASAGEPGCATVAAEAASAAARLPSDTPAIIATDATMTSASNPTRRRARASRVERTPREPCATTVFSHPHGRRATAADQHPPLKPDTT